MANELLGSFFISVTSLKSSNCRFLTGLSTLLIPAVWRVSHINLMIAQSSVEYNNLKRNPKGLWLDSSWDLGIFSLCQARYKTQKQQISSWQDIIALCVLANERTESGSWHMKKVSLHASCVFPSYQNHHVSYERYGRSCQWKPNIIQIQILRRSLSRPCQLN